MICKSCGKQIDADSKYCQYCGAEQDGILKCHKEHYSSSEIKSLSWYEYNKLMADELNENGFECHTSPFSKTFTVSEPDFRNPTYPLVNDLSRLAQVVFLKKKGLLDNGRCPQCGKDIKPNDIGKYTYTDGTYKNVTYHICKDCYREGMHMSLNPAQQKGCIVALLLIPYNLICAWVSSLNLIS